MNLTAEQRNAVEHVVKRLQSTICVTKDYISLCDSKHVDYYQQKANKAKAELVVYEADLKELESMLKEEEQCQK